MDEIISGSPPENGYSQDTPGPHRDVLHAMNSGINLAVYDGFIKGTDKHPWPPIWWRVYLRGCPPLCRDDHALGLNPFAASIVQTLSACAMASRLPRVPDLTGMRCAAPICLISSVLWAAERKFVSNCEGEGRCLTQASASKKRRMHGYLPPSPPCNLLRARTEEELEHGPDGDKRPVIPFPDDPCQGPRHLFKVSVDLPVLREPAQGCDSCSKAQRVTAVVLPLVYRPTKTMAP